MLALKLWQTPFYACFLFFGAFYFFSVCDRKRWENMEKHQKKMVSTSKQCAEHLFAGQNTQQTGYLLRDDQTKWTKILSQL